MLPLFPKPLHQGDLIAITAPSSGVEPALHARLDLVIGHLVAQGWRVEEGHCLRSQSQSASAPAHERAAELMQFLLRDDVAAIIPPWGGELAIELLDRLDWQALRSARPKWILGYSDTSTLLLPITLHLGWATAHGPCLMDLAPGQRDSLTGATMAALATPHGSSFKQNQSSHWQSQWTDFALVPETTYQLTERTAWRCVNRDVDAVVHFEGRLIGGCIDTLTHIANTAHGDVRSFIQSAGSDGVVLYVENAEMSPTALVRALQVLRWAGWLCGVRGVLVGRSAAKDSTGPGEIRYAEALHHCLAELSCPVLVDVDIGHRPPQLVLINGALSSVRWSASDGGQVSQVLA